MAKFKATAAQQQAIDAKGNILVAAAAGSGKTAVLVERVVRLITDPQNPINADELLIVTFTNAAAAEMRSRIEKRLNEECRKDPDNIRLMQQKYLLSTAKICTIDSFCIDLVRENFERADIEPDFKIVDDSIMRPLMQEAMNTTLNRYLSEKGEEIRELLEIIGSEYGDENLANAVNSIFLTSRNIPFPDAYLDDLLKASTMEFSPESPLYTAGICELSKLLDSMLASCAIAVDLVAGYPSKTAPFVRALEQISAQLGNMRIAANNGNWNELYDLIDRYSHSNLRGSSTSDEPDLITVKSIIEQIGEKNAKPMFKSVIFAPVAEINTINQRLARPITLLVEFIKDYSAELAVLQKKSNCYTFYNTEQLALSMLCKYNDGEIVMRDDADVFLDRFAEVLVDEYQDTNDLQDMLFRVLSGKGERLFAVGDVKQSIYAFRGANPDNFLKRKNSAVPIENASLGDAKKIILGNNFRSRSGVCEYINFFFKNLMTAETGNIVYNDEEKLIPSGEFPDSDAANAELLVINANGAEYSSDEEAEDNALIIEARAIAAHIKQIMAEKASIREDKETLRKARYSDFAILMRNQRNRSALLASELRRLGIPVSFSKENFMEALEIQTFCALLEIINNPKQDVPLLTAMMSPIFGFSAEEMADIRIKSPKGDLISAVTNAAENGDLRADEFLKRLADMRNLSVAMPLSRFVSKLLVMSDYLNIAASMQDGAVRRANLLMLVDYSASYSNGATGSLVGFLRYLKKVPAGSLKAAKSAGGENCAQIMSMHSSKGLQFPICIICDLGIGMFSKLSTSKLLFDRRAGIGLRFFDEDSNSNISSPPFIVNMRNERQDRLLEELRLLYVALTRAEERLVIVSYNKNLERKLREFSAMLLSSGSRIDKMLFDSVTSMNDWILMTSLLHNSGDYLRRLSSIPLAPKTDKSTLKIIPINPTELNSSDGITVDENNILPDGELSRLIKQNAEYKYPYSDILNIEAKTTVSKLANSAENERFAFTAKPAFMEKEGLTAASRGTAMHKIIELIGFDKEPNVNAEIERMVEWRFITEAEGRAVDRKALCAFFESKLYNRALSAKDLYREKRFLTEISAGELYPDLSNNLKDEMVVVQGAVDLCFIEDDGIVIVDFKTDHLSEDELIAAYSEQLRFYSKACEKIFELPIKELIIYSFYHSSEISLNK